MPDYFAAFDAALAPLFNASNTLRLLEGAEAGGLMAWLREARTPSEISQRTGYDVEVVLALCTALTANGITRSDGLTYVLTDAWLTLTGPGAYVPLGTAIASNAIEGRLLRELGARDYWALPSTDRLTYARSVSPDPFSDEVVGAVRSTIEADADLAPMLVGGRLLELGCGVAGRILTTLRAAPGLSAVGVELSDDLAEEAHSRAEALGLSDRFTVVCADATEFRTEESFDFGFWSQFFFPAAARPGALASMLAALRPGAVVDAPVGFNPEELTSDPTGTGAREYAAMRVILQSWGVPQRTPATLIAEFAEAGFADARVVPRPGSPVVRAHRP